VVANERELDATGVGDLWLVHLSLDERRGGTGRNLNQLVLRVRQMLQSSITAVTDFDQKLTRIGYLETQMAAYDEPHYEVRTETLFRVSGNFPCITEGMLPVGVGDVRYTVALSACQPYIAVEQEFRERMQNELSA
jgi:hypothetical protein